jgi:hypothetical protein
LAKAISRVRERCGRLVSPLHRLIPARVLYILISPYAGSCGIRLERTQEDEGEEEELIRMISPRKATRRERSIYAHGH